MDGTLMKKIIIEDTNGVQKEVHLVTYLMSDKGDAKYVVYSKGEVSGEEQDVVIYISKIVQEGTTLFIDEITDDSEWSNVLVLLKQIANA